jgi:NADH-quinone oxidoreductase subunit J
VITHTKPVFSALWFILVVCATAGLFLILSAEFMAFAMIIIYGGAILVTYVFVIMLAAQSGEAGDVTDQPEYDRIAAEPIAATAAGFLLLAVLLTVMFRPGAIATPDEAAIARRERVIRTEVLAGDRTLRPEAVPSDDEGLRLLAQRNAAEIHAGGWIDNVQHVGLDLFESHPLGLELAGVILLVSLVGAVVIAKKRVDSAEPAGPGPVTGPAEARGREPGPRDAETLESIQGATPTRVRGTSAGATPGGAACTPSSHSSPRPPRSRRPRCRTSS